LSFIEGADICELFRIYPSLESIN